jgi:hypothetical protein
VTLFVIAVLTVMLTASMVRVRVDLWSARTSRDLTQALAIAQSGLQAYLGTVTEKPVIGESVRINLAGGYADVVAELVRRPADSLGTWTYFVRSTGNVIQPTLGAEPQASRTVGQMATWRGSGIPTVATLTAINGVEYAAGSVFEVDGMDGCGGDATLGLRAPGGSDGPLDTTGVYIGGSWNEIADDTGIDWEGTVDGDHPERLPVSGDTTFGSYFIRGDAYLEDVKGTGLLIVTGELDSEGDFFEWDGVILVGGEFDPDADSTVVRGIVVSGLNQTLGGSVEPNDFNESADDDVYLSYDSCNITRTLERFGGFAAVDNAWVEYWASY